VAHQRFNRYQADGSFQQRCGAEVYRVRADGRNQKLAERGAAVLDENCRGRKNGTFNEIEIQKYAYYKCRSPANEHFD